MNDTIETWAQGYFVEMVQAIHGSNLIILNNRLSLFLSGTKWAKNGAFRSIQINALQCDYALPISENK